MHINHPFRFGSQRLQCVPEFIRLWCRTLSVTVANQNQRWRLRAFDECDRRALGIDLRIVIYRRAEEWDHPFINLIFTIVALVLGNARPGYSRSEAICLRDRPHGHVAAVAPARNAQTMLIHRSLFQHLIDTRKNVAEISIAKIFYIGAGKCLSFSKAAARVGKENEVTDGGERNAEVRSAGPR